MIKTLMKGMGRTPNQKQVNQLMKQMQKYQQKYWYFYYIIIMVLL